MPVIDIIQVTLALIKVTYKLAVLIRDSQNHHTNLKETTTHIATDLTVVGGLLDQLRNFSDRVTVQDEQLVIKNITLLKTHIDEIYTILQDVQRDRNFFQRLFMNRHGYRQQLNQTSRDLHISCVRIQGALPSVAKVSIRRQDFPDFRRTFRNVPEKTLTFYDFSIIKNTPHSILKITLEELDTTKCLCYLKFGNEQFF
jgi:hypothetical protein